MNRKRLIAIFLLVIVASSLIVYRIVNDSNKQHINSNLVQESKQNQVETKKDVPVSIISRSLSVGDVFWSRKIYEWSKNADGSLNYNYPFEKLSTFDRENYDAWIGNMECPVTDKRKSTYAEETLLSFNCMPEFLSYAKKYFTIFGLANNHMDNVSGTVGLIETRSNLEKNDIQYFGHYDPSVKSDLCEIVAMPARLKSSSGSEQAVSFPIAMCGYHHVFKLPTEDELDVISEYSKYFPVWVYVHMGVEYQAKPDSLRVELFRKMIDRGADVVIGGHPHWVQTSEAYKGKLIIYSLGNFIFDQQGSSSNGGIEVRRGAALDITFKTEYSGNVQGLIDLAKICSEFQDGCLEKTKDYSKPKLSYTYNIVASDDTNRQTRKADDNLQRLTKERLNWSATLANLSN